MLHSLYRKPYLHNEDLVPDFSAKDDNSVSSYQSDNEIDVHQLQMAEEADKFDSIYAFPIFMSTGRHTFSVSH